MDGSRVPLRCRRVPKTAFMVQVIHIADKLDVQGLCRWRQEELPVLGSRRETNLFIETAKEMPHIAFRQAEVAAGSQIVRRAETAFAGRQLIRRNLHLFPREFRL